MNGMRIDLDYAIRQLTQFRDIGRAMDALERVKAALDEADTSALDQSMIDEAHEAESMEEYTMRRMR